MARIGRPPKEDAEPTRQVRIFDSDHRLIAMVLAGQPTDKTFADVIRYAMEATFPGLREKVESLHTDIQL